MRQNFTKLLALVVVAVLSFGLVASAQFPDVPADHWAYDAVATLVDEGLLNGMPDGNFHGNEPMNRYSVAMLVAKVLDRIAESSAVVEKVVQQPVTVNQPVQPVVEKVIVERVIQEPVEVTKVIEKEYIEKPVERIIEKHIVHEFAGLSEDEVRALLANMEKEIEYIKDVLKERGDVDAEIFRFTSNKLKALDAAIVANDTKIKDVNKDLTALKADLKEKDEVDADIFRFTSNKLKTLDNDVKANGSKVTELEKKVTGLEEKVNVIGDFASTKSVNEMKDELQAQNDKIVKMERDLKSTRTIAILGLLAGIAGIIVGFVVK